MSKKLISLRNTLDQLIKKVSKHAEDFVRTPGKDFIRTRKLDFQTTMHMMLSMGGGSLPTEVTRNMRFRTNQATVSAFVQQKRKLLPDAFRFLLSEFNKHVSPCTFHDYRLMAVDGSDLQIPTDNRKVDSYVCNQYGGYNYFHLNSIFDIGIGIYVESLTQPANHSNELAALLQMAKNPVVTENCILIADRNYESYNVIANLNFAGQPFAIRIKDLDSKGSIAYGLKPEQDGECDIQVHRTLTKRNTKEVKANPQVYHFLPGKVKFDFMDQQNKSYPVSFRLTRLKIGKGQYETILSNLSFDLFTSKDIKQIYAMRWSIETSFRDLKYSLGLLRLHTKDDTGIEMEILSKLIMYNFCSITAQCIKPKVKNTKHPQQINFSLAIHICMEFLRGNACSCYVQSILLQSTLPIRKGRSYPRKKHRAPINFNYRIL